MAKFNTHLLLLAAAVILIPLGLVLPTWLVFLVTIGLAKGLVVVGLVVMMRAGLVSFVMIEKLPRQRKKADQATGTAI